MIPNYLLFVSMCLRWGNHGDIPNSSLTVFSSWNNLNDYRIIRGSKNVTKKDFQTLSDIGSNSRLSYTSSPTPRGGGSCNNNNNRRNYDNRIIEGGKIILEKVSEFWSSTVGNAFASLKGVFRSEKAKKEGKLMEQLQTMPVREVLINNSTILPPDVIRTAVKHSQMIGNPLQMGRVQDLARILKQWYVRKGYVLNSVTGATLDPETAVAEITVQEMAVSQTPVDIVFCKEMVIDGETGDLMTFRQYRDKKRKELEKKLGGSCKRLPKTEDLKLKRKDMNTTFIRTTGRTKASRIAQAMKLNPGRPFQWIDDRWKKIATSGVFDQILQNSPQPTGDGGICLQVYVTEPPPRHLEYGISKSVWTNSWEGEVDFDWRNVFGGGESVGVLVRRGTKDPSPSVRIRYCDDKFGLEGGYDIEAFSDFLGDGLIHSKKKKEVARNDKNAKNGDDLPNSFSNFNEDSLFSRKGAMFRLRNPISPTIIENTVASASVERTSTYTGRSENIGSASLTLGPFRKLLPFEARSSVSTTITGGTRVLSKTYDDAFGRLLPYSLTSTNTKQILPIFSSSRADKSAPITIALQHTVSLSTHNLPRHEAKAMANSAQIRGVCADGIASSTVKGTTELRIPVTIPRIGTGSFVLFGDWFCVQKNLQSSFYSKSSIGVGIRKPIQGLPVKLDLSYSSEGKFKPMFGLGVDFDV